MSRRPRKPIPPELRDMPKIPNINPLEASLPKIPKTPPAFSRLTSAPQFDESWFQTYDTNPDAAKLFRERMLSQNPGKTLTNVNFFIAQKREKMEKQLGKERLARSKALKEEAHKAAQQKKEEEAQKKRYDEAYKKCQAIQKKIDPYLSVSIERLALARKDIFGEIHSKYHSLVSGEIDRLRKQLSDECFLRGKVPDEYMFFKPMNKIIRDMRKEMCEKMKEYFLKKYAAANNPTIKEAFEKYPAIYTKYQGIFKENVIRVTNGLNDLCPVDETDNYFDEATVSSLMERSIQQMKSEMDASKARKGGRRKTRKKRKTKKGKKDKKSKKKITRKRIKKGGNRTQNGFYAPSNPQFTSHPDEICPICQIPFQETPELAIYKTTCQPVGHNFHVNCLYRLCQMNRQSPEECPICKQMGVNCNEIIRFREKNLHPFPESASTAVRQIYNEQEPPTPRPEPIQPPAGTPSFPLPPNAQFPEPNEPLPSYEEITARLSALRNNRRN